MKKALLTAAIAASLVISVSQASAANMNGLVAKKAAVIAKLHKKAKKALVNAAQDKSYADFVASDEAGRHQIQPRIDKVSLNVQSKFHVEEMCLIDAAGPELARIVGKEVAHDLSADESGAGFFQPGFDQKPKTAYISSLYMSPDANKWVLAYVTPVVVGGENKAILHYEHGLNVYQDTLNKGVKDEWVLAVNKDGFIVSDSRNPVPVAKDGDHEDQSHYFTSFPLAAAKASLDQKQALDVEGVSYTGAYKQVGNWAIFALEQQ